jgi:type 1 glutamine amidotransferase
MLPGTIAAAIAMAGFSVAGQAGVPVPKAVVTDCPLAQAPLSVDSPLADIYAVPAARAVADGIAPGLAREFTRPFGGSALPPNFDRIITLRFMARTQPELLARLDAGLAKVTLARADVVARCARYDHERPALPAKMPHPSVLVFEKITGYRDSPSVDASAKALREIGAQHGWTMVFTDKGGVFNPADLARFDVVVWNNVSGDALTAPQRAVFRRWIEQGGGFAGMHGSGGDPVWFWDWYVDTLVGARFTGHPMSPQFQEARVVTEPGAHPASSGLPPEWRMTDEWYSFARSPRGPGTQVLATLDEGTYNPVGFGGKLSMGDHPIAWTRCVGKGRSFYSAIGHLPATYEQPQARRLLEQGVAWAAGLSGSTCKAGRKTGN